MNVETSKRELQRYCRRHHFWSPLDEVGAHAVGIVEESKPANVFLNFAELKARIERDETLPKEEKLNLIDELVAERRSFERGVNLRATKFEAGERLGTLLKRRREGLGYMVSEVAVKLPISIGAYEQIESGYNQRPPDDILKAICDALALNFEEVQKVADLDKEKPVMGFGAGQAEGFHFHGTFNLLPKAEAGSLHTLRQFFRMKREHLGYTVHEMARKARLSQNVYAGIEAGSEKNPRREDLKKILLALGADPGYVDTLPRP